MLKKELEQRQAIELKYTDMLVPKEHLLRKIDAAVDFTHIYDLVENLYCEDNGRSSCDPVVLFKLEMIQHLFGIRSLRQTLWDA
jgi:transposase